MANSPPQGLQFWLRLCALGRSAAEPELGRINEETGSAKPMSDERRGPAEPYEKLAR